MAEITMDDAAMLLAIADECDAHERFAWAKRLRDIAATAEDTESPRCYCGHGAGAHIRGGSCVGIGARGEPCGCTEYASSGRSEETRT